MTKGEQFLKNLLTKTLALDVSDSELLATNILKDLKKAGFIINSKKP